MRTLWLGVLGTLVFGVSMVACGEEEKASTGTSTTTSSGAGATSGGGGASSSSTGGSTAGSGGEGATGGGATGCAAGDYLLCDDFEGDAPGSAPTAKGWQVVQNNGATSSVDDQRSHGGQHAVHFVTPSGPTVNFLTTKAIFPVAAPGMYGRLHYYVKGPAPVPNNTGVIHSDIVELEGADPNHGNTRDLIRWGHIYNKFSNKLTLLWNFEKRPRPAGFNEIGIDDDMDVTTDQWHCLTWRHQQEGPASQLWHDGEERMNVTSADHAEPYPAFNQLNIGWTLYQSFDGGPYEVWIDDVVVDDEPLTCDQP